MAGERLSRREKQRQENPGRAAKMHEARLAADSPPAVPPPPAGYHIGCSGWFYWDWGGRFYPSQMPTGQWFGHYAAHFGTVELNAPFYSWPTIATVKTWLRQARGREFIYTVKANELITHSRRFTGTKTLIRDFGHIADLLGPHMGCLLYQMPPSYSYSAARLKTILGQLDPARRNVVEFRHKSWWREEVYKAFRKAGAIFCAVSGPRLPDELVQTADDVYLRFHGVTRWYRYHYSDEEVAAWAAKLRKLKAKRVWIYFNNDYEGHAIRNAYTLMGLLGLPQPAEAAPTLPLYAGA